MPDEYGQWDINDWMGLTKAFLDINAAIDTSKVRGQRLQSLERENKNAADEASYRASIRKAGGVTSFDKAFKPTDKENWTALGNARLSEMTIEEKKREFIIKNARYDFEDFLNSWGPAEAKMRSVMPPSSQPQVEPWDDATWQEGYLTKMHLYDKKLDWFDYVKGTEDFKKRTVMMVDHRTGIKKEVPMPSNDEMNNFLSPFASIDAQGRVAETKNGWQLYLSDRTKSAEDRKAFNLESFKNAEIFTNKKGKVVRMGRFFDQYNNRVPVRTGIFIDETGDMLFGDEATEFLRTNGYASQASQQSAADIQSERALAARRGVETQVALKKLSAEERKEYADYAKIATKDLVREINSKLPAGTEFDMETQALYSTLGGQKIPLDKEEYAEDYNKIAKYIEEIKYIEPLIRNGYAKNISEARKILRERAADKAKKAGSEDVSPTKNETVDERRALREAFFSTNQKTGGGKAKKQIGKPKTRQEKIDAIKARIVATENVKTKGIKDPLTDVSGADKLMDWYLKWAGQAGGGDPLADEDLAEREVRDLVDEARRQLKSERKGR